MARSWSSSAPSGIPRPSRKYLPASSIPSTTSLSPSGRGSRFLPLGKVALNPAAISGVTIMKMISSTSMMSIIGTTLGSDLTEVCPVLPTAIAMALTSARGYWWAPASAGNLPAARNRLLGLEFLGEDRAAELAADALDEVVDQLLGGVGHLHGEVLDLGGEVVVRPHRRDGHHEAERRGDQGLGDTGRDARQTAGRPRLGHAGEGVHDTHGGAEEADERRRGAHGRKDAGAPLELGEHDQHL